MLNKKCIFLQCRLLLASTISNESLNSGTAEKRWSWSFFMALEIGVCLCVCVCEWDREAEASEPFAQRYPAGHLPVVFYKLVQHPLAPMCKWQRDDEGKEKKEWGERKWGGMGTKGDSWWRDREKIEWGVVCETLCVYWMSDSLFLEAELADTQTHSLLCYVGQVLPTLRGPNSPRIKKA